MRTLFLILFVFCQIAAYSQNKWTATFKAKRNFTLGESYSYNVKEFFKIDNIFVGFKATSESIATFKIVDTSNGGYWIRYSTTSIFAKSKNDKSIFVMNELMDKIQLFVFVKDGTFMLDSLSYHKTKKSIADDLDSIAGTKTFDKNTTRYITFLKAELQEEAGLGSLLGSLVLWQQYYISGEFKKFRLTMAGEAQNILSQKQYSGVIENELLNISKDSSVTLQTDFTGDPTSTARYYKGFYEKLIKLNNKKIGKLAFPPEMRYNDYYIFKTALNGTFPNSLTKKTVAEYLVRSVVRTEMYQINLLDNY